MPLFPKLNEEEKSFFSLFSPVIVRRFFFFLFFAVLSSQDPFLLPLRSDFPKGKVNVFLFPFGGVIPIIRRIE